MYALSLTLGRLLSLLLLLFVIYHNDVDGRTLESSDSKISSTPFKERFKCIGPDEPMYRDPRHDTTEHNYTNSLSELISNLNWLHGPIEKFNQKFNEPIDSHIELKHTLPHLPYYQHEENPSAPNALRDANRLLVHYLMGLEASDLELISKAKLDLVPALSEIRDQLHSILADLHRMMITHNLDINCTHIENAMQENRAQYTDLFRRLGHKQFMTYFFKKFAHIIRHLIINFQRARAREFQMSSQYSEFAPPQPASSLSTEINNFSGVKQRRQHFSTTKLSRRKRVEPRAHRMRWNRW